MDVKVFLRQCLKGESSGPQIMDSIEIQKRKDKIRFIEKPEDIIHLNIWNTIYKIFDGNPSLNMIHSEYIIEAGGISSLSKKFIIRERSIDEYFHLGHKKNDPNKNYIMVILEGGAWSVQRPNWLVSHVKTPAPQR